ncbi:hypothetical protein LIPSTDRAFT_105845 [Lipomyces starkeyi NRRL Y-11557]|uniref:Uncharacterized protein n=1 Tax=Lipomyces starkeyi NRRL Y-11557 TaxID=675824 RepID=A0A1E3Q3N6_LIPST|nr:hypothetical protein LIPSTDRAFT_105845 [Lipomyces starkeyi NRRL Y-11557]
MSMCQESVTMILEGNLEEQANHVVLDLNDVQLLVDAQRADRPKKTSKSMAMVNNCSRNGITFRIIRHMISPVFVRQLEISRLITQG